jgi:hypothetical protein
MTRQRAVPPGWRNSRTARRQPGRSHHWDAIVLSAFRGGGFLGVIECRRRGRTTASRRCPRRAPAHRKLRNRMLKAPGPEETGRRLLSRAKRTRPGFQGADSGTVGMRRLGQREPQEPKDDDRRHRYHGTATRGEAAGVRRFAPGARRDGVRAERVARSVEGTDLLPFHQHEDIQGSEKQRGQAESFWNSIRRVTRPADGRRNGGRRASVLPSFHSGAAGRAGGAPPRRAGGTSRA